MLPNLKFAFLLSLLLVLFNWNIADEGMWMPQQIKMLDLYNQGLKLNPGQIYDQGGGDLISAVVHIRTGGTGSFVSKDGLIFTNHHVAFGALQRASNENKDYISNGFLANTRENEIPAPGYYIDVLLGIEDITPIVLKKVNRKKTAQKRYEFLEQLEKKLVEKEEKKSNDIYCQFKSFYSGNKYYLFKYKRIRDIRIVYAPPRSIGNFGGEIDNWMWPRHTGDFSFLRAYVSKNNIGISYNRENIPYHPKTFLKVSLEGIKEGDFTFSIGYPGKTQRNNTLAELQLELKKNKQKIDAYKGMVNFYEGISSKNRGLMIKYASRLKSIHNGLKNRKAKIKGIQRWGVIEKKREFEKDLEEWIQKNPKAHAKYSGILSGIEKFIKEKSAFYIRKQRLDDLVDERIGPVLLCQAHLIYRTVEERQKTDIKRDSKFRDNNLPEIMSKIELAERLYEPLSDKAFFKLILKQMFQWEKNSWPNALKSILEKGEESIDKYANKIYNNTGLTNPEKRVELIRMNKKNLLAQKDPLILLAANLEKEMKLLRKKENILNQELMDLKKIYLAALLDKFQGKIAPDANATIRFTYGSVKGYYPKDGVKYLPQTTLTGIIEKNTGVFPFKVPDKIKTLYENHDFGAFVDKKLNDIATCFINTTNVTGGSSGSPVMNANGEIIGISFDMVYESVIGDFFIIPEIQRVINADIRYIIFIADKFSNAKSLVNELNLNL